MKKQNVNPIAILMKVVLSVYFIVWAVGTIIVMVFFSSCKKEYPCGTPNRYEIKIKCLLVGPKGCVKDETDGKVYFTYDAIDIVTGEVFWEDQELKSPKHSGELVEYCTCSEIQK